MTLVSDCIRRINQTPLTDPTRRIFEFRVSEVVGLAYPATCQQMAFVRKWSLLTSVARLRELQMSMRPARAPNGGDLVCCTGMLTVTCAPNCTAKKPRVQV